MAAVHLSFVDCIVWDFPKDFKARPCTAAAIPSESVLFSILQTWANICSEPLRLLSIVESSAARISCF